MRLKITNGVLVTLASPHPKSDTDLAIVENKNLIIEGDRIVDITSSSPFADITIDAHGNLVLPGFVDPHTHLVFAGDRSWELILKLQGKSYEELRSLGGGIWYTVEQTRRASINTLIASALPRLRYAFTWGTTTMEIKSGYGLDKPSELKLLHAIQRLQSLTPIDLVPTFLGAHDIPRDMPKPDYIHYLLNDILPSVIGLAEFIDIFCERNIYTPTDARLILEAGKQHGLIPKIHADQLSHSGGTQVAADVGAISADHLEHADEPSLRKLKSTGTIAVLLPGTTFYLRTDTIPPIDLLRKYKIPIALGTDFNPGSSPILSLPFIMSLASLLYGLTPEECLIGVTLNAAYAINRGTTIGSLQPGKYADILVTRFTKPEEFIYWIDYNPITWVIKRGNPFRVEH